MRTYNINIHKKNPLFRLIFNFLGIIANKININKTSRFPDTHRSGAKLKGESMKRELIVGGGCFWCTEAVFELLKGVSDVESGYANGHTPDPTYRDICTGDTGYAEVIKITYDDSIITVDTLLDIFFVVHDPTTLNRQGADRGTQYRSTILYTDEETKEAAEAALEAAQADWNDPIVTKIEPLECYYTAEAYHQDYYQQNPMQGYCMAVIPPKLAKLKAKFGKEMA
jgi:methionine-S-sulfoxide reductase